MSDVQQGPKKISGGYDVVVVMMPMTLPSSTTGRLPTLRVRSKRAACSMPTSGLTVIGSGVIAAFTFVQSR